MAHYHVKSNTQGALKDGYVHCLASDEVASLALVGNIRTLVAWLSEGCDKSNGVTGCDRCPWCRASSAAWELTTPETARAAKAGTELHGASTVEIKTPTGVSIFVRMEQVDGSHKYCADL